MARAFLREHETTGLVLLAHTDTTGGESRNRALAAERGSVVRRVLLREGTSADRQLAVFAKTGSFEAVVDDLAEQSMLGA